MKIAVKNDLHRVPKMMKMETNHDVPNVEDEGEVRRATRKGPLQRLLKTVNSKSRTSITATRTRKASSKKNDLDDDHAAEVGVVGAVGAETAMTAVDHKVVTSETFAIRMTSRSK